MKTLNRVSPDVWATLSYIRFVLAVWVLFAHTANFGPVERAMPVPSSNALVAVYCFLVISGFSIHHSILQRPGNYTSRRFWRIAPTHIASLTIAVLAYLVSGPILFDGKGNPFPVPTVSGWLTAAFLLQAFVPVARLAVLFPAWSLSLECVYYVLAPLLIRLRVRWALCFISGSIVFCILRPKISNLYIGSDTFGISVIALLWAWLSGWIVYTNVNRVWWLMLTGCTGSVAIVVDPLLNGWFNHVIWWTTLLVCLFAKGNFLNAFARKLGNYLGDLSYPLYLTHYPVLFLSYNWILKKHFSLNFGITQVLIALSASCLIYHFVDYPLRKRAAISRIDLTSVSPEVYRS